MSGLRSSSTYSPTLNRIKIGIVRFSAVTGAKASFSRLWKRSWTRWNFGSLLWLLRRNACGYFEEILMLILLHLLVIVILFIVSKETVSMEAQRPEPEAACDPRVAARFDVASPRLMLGPHYNISSQGSKPNVLSSFTHSRSQVN